MVFILRHPGYTNQYCTHDTNAVTTANAGAVVYITGEDTATGRTKIATVSGTTTKPFGFLMQKVKAASSDVPTGYRWPGDLGSSDAYSGDPVGVAHLGIAETTNYVLDAGQTTFTAGEALYASAAGSTTTDGKLVNGTSGTVAQDDGASNKIVARCMNSLTAADVTAAKALRVQLLI